MALTKINNNTLSAVTTLPAAIATGKVLQVVTATDSTVRSTTSTSFVTASNTLSLSITPSSASNKILIIVTSNTSSSSDYSYYTIYKGATNLGDATYGFASTFDANQGGTGSTTAINYLDSPASTSALTYQVYFKAAGSATGNLNFRGSLSSITAMEISA
jgi:hypothetical protein